MDKVILDKYMQSLKGGNEFAFDIIYEETKKGVFYFILSFVKNYHLAEDLMQNTYIKVKCAITSYKAGTNPLAWILTIAKNLCLNELKRLKKEIATDFNECQNAFGEYQIEDKLSSPTIKLIKETLSQKEQQIVLLYIVGGYKHKEIADMLFKPLGTVLWSYRNAIAKLKRKLEEEENENR